MVCVLHAERFLGLDQGEKVMAEYVWIGGNNELRCKTKTLTKAPKSVDELPVWNYDGSSTDQAPGTDSEVLLYPRAIYRDPFRAGPSGKSDNIIVLCDCYKPDPDGPKGVGEAIPTNTRVACNAVMDKVKHLEPWFGIEQEYTLFEPDRVTPYGWYARHARDGGQPCTAPTGYPLPADHPTLCARLRRRQAEGRLPRPPAGPVLLLDRHRERVRPPGCRGALQGVPVRRHQHLGHQR